MTRYILQPQHGDRITESGLEAVRRIRGVQIIDAFRDRAILIESTPEDAEQIKRDLPGWTLDPEIEYPKPHSS